MTDQPTPVSSPPTVVHVLATPGQQPTNMLGVLGFVLSLVGLVGEAGACLCLPIVIIGLLCPIGAIVAAFGLRHEPKGMAITGLVLGIVGSIIWIVLLVLIFGFGLLVASEAARQGSGF